MTPRMFLTASVAALAIATPAVAKPDKDDRGQQAQQAQQAERQSRAERPQRAERQQVQRAERPQVQRAERQERRMERAEAPRIERQQQRVERQEIRRAVRPARIERQQQRAERQEIRRAERPARIERQQQRAERQEIRRADRIERPRVERAERQVRRIERQQVRRVDTAEAPRIERTERRAERFERRMERGERRAERSFIQALAPVAETREMRPMRAQRFVERARIGERVAASALAPVPTLYAQRYVDTSDYYYRYDDDLGYIYRLDRDDDIVRAMIPLFGGYTVGTPWPVTYRSSYVPFAYRDLYYDSDDYYYRYDGTGIYRIDAGTQLITALVALLTGQGLGIGQMLPSSYGVYNVPLAYRSNYFDRDDAWYRYGDGFIYEVDPFTRRIEQRYPLYAGYDDYMIGSPWPAAYPDYNVPYAYRDMYYDSPQYHYRYASGGIYRVDPTTQLITALVALVTGQQFQVGQPMPAGYAAYNVPFALRDEYYDRGDDWYRYADGYVYRIDADSGMIEEAIPVYA
jgi:hypothetical protein